jgi:ABC-type branched-subunit amino acid transport system substrate-binding protein
MKTLIARFAAAAVLVGSCLPAAAETGVTKDKIILGSFLPLQSGLAAGAVQLREGADSYFRWINDNGGIHGRKIEWIVENDSYNPQQALAVSRKMVDRDGVFAIVSTIGTVTNLAALPFLSQRGVPVINPAGSNEKLNAPTEKEVFGMLPVGQRIGESMAGYALDKLGAKKVAIFYQNDQFGKDQRDGAVDFLTKRGIKPVAEASYVPSDVDVSAQAAALRDTAPDVVLMFTIVKQGALLLKEAEKAGWKPKFIAMNTMGDPILGELAGSAAEGLTINIMTAVDTMDNPAVKQANEILAKYYPNTRPGYYTYLGAAGAIAFHKAAEKVGPDLTRAKLISALESLGRWEPGVVPPLDWGPGKHSGPTTFGYVVWEGGKLKVLEAW